MMLTQTLAMLIPIIAIGLGIGLAMLAIFLRFKKQRELFALYHQERMLALEKGLEVPPLPKGLLDEDEAEAPYNPRRHLLKGLVWLFIGIALGLGLWSVVDTENTHYSLFSLIFVGIGAAHLIYYFVEGRKHTDMVAQGQPLAAPRA